MARRLRQIAALLLAVLLATVLSPSYAWEASSTQASDGIDLSAFADQDGQEDPLVPEDSHHHHGCAGHMLGHLQAQLTGDFTFVAFESPAGKFPEAVAHFLSHFPDTIDRPPLAHPPA